MTAIINSRQLHNLSTSCLQLSQLSHAVNSVDSWNKLSTVFTTETSAWQLWQLLQAFHIFESFVRLLEAKKSYLISFLISKGQIIKASTRLRVSEWASHWHGYTMIWPGFDNKQNCAPCTLQRGQVEYKEGHEKGEEGKSQADHWNLNKVGQGGQWNLNNAKKVKVYFKYLSETNAPKENETWRLNFPIDTETLGDILFISSSTSALCVYPHWKAALRNFG